MGFNIVRDVVWINYMMGVFMMQVGEKIVRYIVMDLQDGRMNGECPRRGPNSGCYMGEVSVRHH